MIYFFRKFATDMETKIQKTMKTSITRTITMLLTGVLLLSIPVSANAQKKAVSKKLQQPSSPSPIDQQERTIKDLLYFPYGCLSSTISNADEAKAMLENTFGTSEKVNNVYLGLHNSSSYNYTYRGIPIGLCHIDWFDNREWYDFYFDSKAEAQQFYTKLASDVTSAGIPLTKDKVYGGVSNRKRPVSIFKWVYVAPPTMIKEVVGNNIHHADVVGKYVVEFGVYKKH